jgi:aryl-alcohol dehydrogenase-like predicted oxidoreductase
MQYNRIGNTEFRISAVGFGTCQLRLVPERQAIDTLKRGFELGVNWVHTAPDDEGADDLIARAIAESGHDVMTFSQGYGAWRISSISLKAPVGNSTRHALRCSELLVLRIVKGSVAIFRE